MEDAEDEPLGALEIAELLMAVEALAADEALMRVELAVTDAELGEPDEVLTVLEVEATVEMLIVPELETAEELLPMLENGTMELDEDAEFMETEPVLEEAIDEIPDPVADDADKEGTEVALERIKTDEVSLETARDDEDGKATTEDEVAEMLIGVDREALLTEPMLGPMLDVVRSSTDELVSTDAAVELTGVDWISIDDDAVSLGRVGEELGVASGVGDGVGVAEGVLDDTIAQLES